MKEGEFESEEEVLGEAPEQEESPVLVAANTMLGDLMACVVEQMKEAQKPWQQMSENDQADYLHRIEQQCKQAVRKVVHIIASDNRPTVACVVESVTFKGGVKTVLKASKHCTGVLDLAVAEGQFVTVVINDTEQYESGGNKPTSEPDQKPLSLDDQDGESVIGEKDAVYGEAVALVIKEQKCTISFVQRSLKIGYNRASRLVDAMEENSVVGEMGSGGQREVLLKLPEE